jgi:hypothetical protein
MPVPTVSALPVKTLEARMREYKLYCMGNDGRIEKRHDIYANDDLDALDRARELCAEYEIEIWQGSQLLTRVAKDGTASWNLSP